MPARVESLDGDDLTMRVGSASEGMIMTTPWKKTPVEDRAALANALLRGAGDTAGSALAAYWHLAAGDLKAGKQALAMAGTAGEGVKKAFTWPTVEKPAPNN